MITTKKWAELTKIMLLLVIINVYVKATSGILRLFSLSKSCFKSCRARGAINNYKRPGIRTRGSNAIIEKINYTKLRKEKN